MSDKPLPGKCGAKLAKRPGYCEKAPTEGHKRCRLHGGTDRIGRPPVTGQYSERFRRLEPIAQAAIDQAIQDPDLLDLRRPVALQSVIVQETPLVPNEDLVKEFAKRLSRWRPGPGETWDDQPDPSDAELDLARMRWLERSGDIVDQYAASVARTVKAAALEDALAKHIVPIFAELAGRMTKLAARFVPADQREAFDAAFRMEVRSTVAQIISLDDE